MGTWRRVWAEIWRRVGHLGGGGVRTRGAGRIRFVALCLCVAMVEGLLTPAVALAAPVASCSGTLTGVSVPSPVTVSKGNVCTLVNVTVSGSSQITVDGTLVADNSTLGGAVAAHAGATVRINGGFIGGSLTVQGPGTTIDLNGGTVKAAVNFQGPGVPGTMTCPVAIGGALNIATSAVSVVGAGCTIGGALNVTSVPLG